MRLSARAPASMMLLGEYAVLQGKMALVSALNQHMDVELIPNADSEILIHSALYGQHKTDIRALTTTPQFRFVMGILRHYQSYLTTGCRISITSTFSDQVGLGSSAAVLVATLAIVRQWLGMSIAKQDLLSEAKQIVLAVQGVGSGADVAAAIYGGFVAYCSEPLQAETLPFFYPLTAVYVGFKTPTVDAIQKVQAIFKANPRLFVTICDGIGLCAEQGIQAVRQKNWSQLGLMMDIQQGFLTALQVSLPKLDNIRSELKQYPEVLGAKISGSGLGDCVIGLGDLPTTYEATFGQRIAVEVAQEGVVIENLP